MERTWISVNGVVRPAAEATVSALDRGFLFADSVYEVTRTAGGRPLFWADHVARLWRSAAFVQLDLPFEPALLRADVDATLAATDHDESYLRVVVTRGVGGLSMALGGVSAPTRVVYAAPLPAPDPAHRRAGIVLRTFGDPGAKVDPRAKHGDRRATVLASARARAAGGDEALRVDAGGQILEGATSTFFWVRGGVVETPPLGAGVLAGITRHKLLEVAADRGVPLVEAPLWLTALPEATEAFISSSTRGVVPVRQIDGHRMVAPGPLTARLLAGYDALLAANASSAQ